MRQRPFSSTPRGVARGVTQSRKVNIPIPTIDAFLFMSHISLLRTSKGKGNGHDNGGICKGKQHRARPSRSAREACRLRIFKEKRSGVDTGRLELKRCLEYLREGDTLLVTKIDRLARSTSDLYRTISELGDKGVAFRVVDDPTIDTTSRTGKLVMGILALIAEFENDIRRERQVDGIAKAKERGVHFGRKLELTPEKVAEIKSLRLSGETVPEIIRQTNLSKASVYRALGG